MHQRGGGGSSAPRPLPWIRHWLQLSINVRSVKDELFRRPAVASQNYITLLGAFQVFPHLLKICLISTLQIIREK